MRRYATFRPQLHRLEDRSNPSAGMAHDSIASVTDAVIDSFNAGAPAPGDSADLALAAEQDRLAGGHVQAFDGRSHALIETAAHFGYQIEADDFKVMHDSDATIALAAIHHDTLTRSDLEAGVDLAAVFIRFPDSGIRPGFYLLRATLVGDDAQLTLIDRQGRVGGRLDTEFRVVTDPEPGDCGSGISCEIVPHDDGTVTKTCCSSVACSGFIFVGCVSATAGTPVD
jgi:hypothetical protein